MRLTRGHESSKNAWLASSRVGRRPGLLALSSQHIPKQLTGSPEGLSYEANLIVFILLEILQGNLLPSK